MRGKNFVGVCRVLGFFLILVRIEVILFRVFVFLYFFVYES